jgi:hypothetical protein
VKTFVPVVLGFLVATCGVPVAAAADPGSCGMIVACPPGGAEPPSGDDGVSSSPTRRAVHVAPRRVCSVYANAVGMGARCVALGQGRDERRTLRERFGGQAFQRCRYSAVPPGFRVPPNLDPDRARFMLQRCQENVDFDTYDGGPRRTISVQVVAVPVDREVRDDENPLNRFLWDGEGTLSGMMPVPSLRIRPLPLPVVGVPAYLTFQWVDPATSRPVAGGVRRVESNGFTMVARAVRVRVDPRQRDLPPVTCSPDASYLPGRPAAEQPAGSCSITFPRSSASARRLATRPIPAHVRDAFHAGIEVTWQVTYGESGRRPRTLGDGFTMRITQAIPVREVQAPNQPPAVIY